MPSTHVALHVHVVFSTKDRYGFIEPFWRPRLFEYLGGCCNHVDVVPDRIGGVGDHVHLLLGLKATHRLSDVLRKIKGPSSEWIHEEIGVRKFGWQEGYGAFSVSPSNRDAVREYIERQEEHHRRKTFQDEYRELLLKSGVEFDERFLW